MVWEECPSRLGLRAMAMEHFEAFGMASIVQGYLKSVLQGITEQAKWTFDLRIYADMGGSQYKTFQGNLNLLWTLGVVLWITFSLVYHAHWYHIITPTRSCQMRSLL